MFGADTKQTQTKTHTHTEAEAEPDGENVPWRTKWQHKDKGDRQLEKENGST